MPRAPATVPDRIKSMCGLGGLLTRQAQTFPHAAVMAMGSALRHRGPDDQGYLVWDEQDGARRVRELACGQRTRLALIHRRLAIIDLSDGGWQPMRSHDARFDVILNGEIYNYLELRRELEAAGETFCSASDTEVLLAAWTRWGESALERFTGMFAFAIVDWRARRLTLVRDCFGIKPLYYTQWPGGFAFASEAKAFLELPGVSRRVSPRAVHRYLAFGLSDVGGETLLADIRELPPASILDIDLDTVAVGQPRRYWHLPQVSKDGPSFKEASIRLRDLFVDSVRIHLRSDVPVGAALSGGIDSSAIVMAMRAIGGRTVDLHAFTYVADDPGVDEERWADLVGDAAGVTMHKVRIAPDEFANDLDRLVADQDFPFGSTSIYAQHRVFAVARDAGIKVMLDGQGADEMFAGYRPYMAARVASLLRSGRIGSAVRLFRRTKDRSGAGGTGRSAMRVAAGLVPASVLHAGYRMHQWDGGHNWLNRQWFVERGAVDEDQMRRGRSSLHEALAITFAETNLPALLRYEDRNSMAHSIESRVPFLTRDLVEFVFSLPEEYLIDADGTDKSVLRAALRGLVPDAILDRCDKIGFQTPELAWLRHLDPWVRRVLTSEAARQNPVIHAQAALREWEAVRVGLRRFDRRVWRWLNLIRWSELMQARFD